MKNLINKAKEKISALIQSGAMHIIIGSFIIKFVAFFGSIFVVKLLSKEEYGILCYYENIIGYFTIFCGAGLASAMLRYIVLADTRARQKDCYIYSIKLGTIWNICLIIAGFLFMLFFRHPASFADYRMLGIIITISIPFVFFENLSYSTMRALFEYKSYSVIAVALSLMVVVFRIAGAKINGSYGVGMGKALGECIGGIFVIAWVMKKYFSRVQLENNGSEFNKELKSYSVQMMITDGLWTIFMLNDLFLLGQLCGSETLIADYKIAYVIPANLSIITSSIGMFVSPYYTKMDADGKYDLIKKYTNKLLFITVSIMALAVLVCFVLAKPIIGILFGPEYYSAVPIMRLLLVAAFFNCGIRSTIANILSAIGAQKENLKVAVVGIVAQIALDLLLIPKYSGTGVAISSLCVYFLMGVVLYVFYYKRYNRAS